MKKRNPLKLIGKKRKKEDRLGIIMYIHTHTRTRIFPRMYCYRLLLEAISS